MDVNGLEQGNFLNIPYDIDSVSNNNDKVIKEVKKSQPMNKEYNKQDLDKALKKLNKFLEDEIVHAEYSVHKDLKTVMIKIVNDKTKDVVMEIPPKKILDMVASMCKQFGLIDKKV